MIRIFVTGGTFDKEYNELSGDLFFKDTHIPEILKIGRSTVDVDLRTLMMIDSLKMTATDRKVILQNCKKTTEDKIIITHGTDTMVDTAKLLGKNIKNKTIVLTGAIIPYRLGSSDSCLNLGSALAFAQTLPYGVYIVMNGKRFLWNNCKKNKKTGFFEEVE